MNKKIKINIKDNDTIFIDKDTGRELSKEEFAKKHGGIKSQLRGVVRKNGKKKEEKGKRKN